jgi:predicted dehydrogenase
MEINKYNELSIAVIGCGSIGKRHVEVLDKMGVGRIIACDPSEEMLKVIKEICPRCEPVSDYREALKEKPFAVYVLTPTKMHIPQAIEALEAGCHVFIEKPLSNSSEGTDRLAEVEKRTRKKVMAGFCFRYHDAHLYAKQILKTGRIGRLVSMRALAGENFPAVHPEYREMYLSKYSGAFEIVHDVDLAIWYADQEVEQVCGIYGPFSDHDFESPDTVEMLMKFKNKCIASVHLDFFRFPDAGK